MEAGRAAPRFVGTTGPRLAEMTKELSHLGTPAQWKAQLRPCSRYRRLTARGVHEKKACVAIARELAAFVWDVARHVPVER